MNQPRRLYWRPQEQGGRPVTDQNMVAIRLSCLRAMVAPTALPKAWKKLVRTTLIMSTPYPRWAHYVGLWWEGYTQPGGRMYGTRHSLEHGQQYAITILAP